VANLNITNIPAPRVPFIDERTGLMAREWYRFFLNLFVLTGSGNNPVSLEELQLGPPNQPDLTELLIQINQNIAPQYEDQSGDFLATLDTAQLMSMMSRFENAEAAIQGAYLQPVVQTGTIASYNLDSSPTAGGVAYGTGPALAVSAAGTLGQVLTSGGAGAPTWATDAGGSVTSVSVVSANGLAGTVATATTTPAITLSTTITGLLKGNGTAISAAASGTDYAPATSGTSILYGNGAGGFSNVTIGTGVAFSAGTLSATGSGGTVTSVAALTLGTAGTDLSSTVATGTTTPVITLQVPTASASNRGALSAADWTTFNNKQPAGSYLVSGGALGTPSSGTVTNLTGTASININGTVGATTPTTGSFTTMKASTGAAVGGATPGTGGLAFPATAVAVADANTLDDYEEGNWTAAFVPSTSGTITLTAATGTYVKIGRSVTISGLFTVASVAAPVGYLIITGLPFSGGTGTSFRTAVSIVASGLAATMTTFLTATIQSDSNIYVIKSNGTGGLSGGAEAIQAGSEIFIGGTYQIS